MQQIILEGALNIELKQQNITAIRAKDLIRLLLLAVPKQIGLRNLKIYLKHAKRLMRLLHGLIK